MTQTPIMLKFFWVIKILFFVFSLLIWILSLRWDYISKDVWNSINILFPAYLVIVWMFYGYIFWRVAIIIKQLQQPEKINKLFMICLVVGLIIWIALATFYMTWSNG